MFFEVAGLPGGGFFLGEKYSKPPPPMEPMEKTLKYIYSESRRVARNRILGGMPC